MTNYILNYFQAGMQNWLQIPLTGQSFSIGRTAENDLALADALVSRQHAGLYVDERGVWIIDKNSSNGVYLSGVRIPAGEWQWLPLSTDILIGTTTLRLEAVPTDPFAAQAVVPQGTGTMNSVPAAYWQAPPAQPARKSRLPLIIIGLIISFVILAGIGFGIWYVLNEDARNDSNPERGISVSQQPTQIPLAGPPQVFDSLPAAPGAGAVQDDQGVSISVPEGSLESGQQAYLERAKLSPGMQADIEKAYQVDSLLYAVSLKDGEDGTGRVDLSLPAPSPDSQLAVLVDDRYLGILETPAQDGVFHVSPGLVVPEGGEGYPEPDHAVQAPNRYLVVTPKAGASLVPQETIELVSFGRGTGSETKSCISEFWTVNHCLRNAEGSVYVFWENDVPASLKDQEYLRIEDTIQSIAEIMGKYQQNGFSAAAISPSNPAYLVVEAGASEPYYSFKTGNVYLPWDIIGGISETVNQCNIAHEFFHWIEDEEYVMGTAALSNPKSWWLEVSAENGSFLLYPKCMDQNLTKYGIVTTSGNVLGFQAAPFLWDGGEQARYIHALQFYLSLCDGGPGCALSQQAWAQAINSGTYPMEGAAATAYMSNAKDLGLYLLGASPQQSRGNAEIPPSAISGSHYGDYLILKTGGKSIWDYGMTTNQFSATSANEVAITAKVEQGGVYPLWVGNGTGTPMGGVGGHTGPPGLLEIQPGPAFWIRQDQNEPVFYPAGSGLILGPISDKLGIGKARIVAVAPDTPGTFQAKVTLADFSGDWIAEGSNGTITPVNCEGYSASSENTLGNGPDELLGFFSGLGEYVNETPDAPNLNLTWQGTLPQGLSGSSEVIVEADKVTLHYRIEMPKQAETGSLDWVPGIKMIRQSLPAHGDKPGKPLQAALPAMPLLVGAAWLGRHRKNKRLVMILLLVGGCLLLYGCVGLSVWGNIDATYTFNKVEYVGPQPGATATDSDAQAIWKLSDGQVKYNFDLTMLVASEDMDGNTTESESPCVLTATGNATATIVPEGTIPPPDLSQ
jgi:flagellar basal body-associated protein FliL